MTGNRIVICLIATLAFVILAVGLETCSRTMVATAQIKASAKIAVAHERTERSGGRLNTIRCVLRHPTCEEQP